MNKRLVLRLLGVILVIEALAMVPATLLALLYGDGDFLAMLESVALPLVIGLPLWRLIKPVDRNLRAREGFAVVALAWILLSVFGAMPFMLSGMLPNFTDALFEAASGFTTTGATVLTDFDTPRHGVMFWRSFTHWIGGMGVLVLTLALIPQMTGRTSHLVRAESPGPSLSKIVPKMGDTARILYTIYGAMTLIEFVALMFAGMSPYDAAIHAMGTAGTGGFSNYAASVGAFDSAVIDVIITVFMVLFGVNFALFFYMLTGHWRDVFRSEELKWYLGIFLFATAVITVVTLPQYGTVPHALRYASFQVASIMSTTGYATADDNLWPQSARMLAFILMFVGSCAGSTAGGLKIVRVAQLCKLGRREIRRSFQPRSVHVIRFDGHGVDETMLSQTAVFFFVYVALILVGALAASLLGSYDLETNFTAALTCVSNVGPGLGAVGPAGSFAGYTPAAKVMFTMLMLCGRLELFPILALFAPVLWRR